MSDIYSNIAAELALVPAVKSAAGEGPAMDMRGSASVTFLVNTGAIVSDGDFGVKLQESDTTTSGDFTDAPAEVVASNAPATLAASSAYKLTYRGYKRYARLALTKAGGTSIALGAVAARHLYERPVA